LIDAQPLVCGAGTLEHWKFLIVITVRFLEGARRRHFDRIVGRPFRKLVFVVQRPLPSGPQRPWLPIRDE
jgi:hypothetical protein